MKPTCLPQKLGGGLPTVTIGMPVFNGQCFLRQAIDSLLGQTYADFELVISDNASTDATSTICQEYAAKDDRIRYVRQERNMGASSNFRYLLRGARGRYFMWAAADDCWQSDWLEVLIGAIRPTDIVVRGTPVIVDTRGNTLGRIALANHRRGSHFSLFMENEFRSRAFYIYGLYETRKIQIVDFAPLEHASYAGDILFIANMISYGDIRHVESTQQFCRRHPLSGGTLEGARFRGWQRIVYRVHPFSYYWWSLKLCPTVKKPLFVLGIPAKHIYLQVSLWLRGFRKLVRRGARP